MSAPAAPRTSWGGDVVALTGHQLRLLSRRPAAIVGAVVIPLIFTLLFAAVFSGVMGRAGIDYAQYLLPAVIVQSSFFTGMGAAVGTAEQAAGGVVRRLRSMPVAASALVVATLAAVTVRGAVTLAVVVPAGYGLGFRFGGPWWATAGFVALAVLLTAAISAGFVALGLRVRRVVAVQAVANLVFFPLLLASNAFTPAWAFPGVLETVVATQPVSRVADALRSLASPVPETGVVVIALGWLVALATVFLVLGTRAAGRRG